MHPALYRAVSEEPDIGSSSSDRSCTSLGAKWAPIQGPRIPFTPDQNEIEAALNDATTIFDQNSTRPFLTRTVTVTGHILCPAGRSTGEAYVVFSTPEDVQKALVTLNKQYMGSRYIE